MSSISNVIPKEPSLHPNLNLILVLISNFLWVHVFTESIVPIYLYHILISTLLVNAIALRIQYTLVDAKSFGHLFIALFRFGLGIMCISLLVYNYNKRSSEVSDQNTWLTYLVFASSTTISIAYPLE